MNISQIVFIIMNDMLSKVNLLAAIATAFFHNIVRKRRNIETVFALLC